MNPTTTSHAPRCEWDYCRDDMHVDGDSCPTCDGWMTGCPDEQCHDAAHDSLPDDATGKEVTPAVVTPTPRTAAGTRPTGEFPPARRSVTPLDRVTWDLPFAAETEIPTDDTQPHTVTLRLTDDGARRLARDLTRKHMTDLVLLARLRTMRRRDQDEDLAREYHEVETRLAAALAGLATTEWTLTTEQAEDLAEQLTDAATEPPTCDVGTCTGYAVTSGLCAAHAERA